MDERSVAREVFASERIARSGEARAVRRRTHQDLLAAVQEEQEGTGRTMTDSELDRFAREFHAPEYRQDVRRIMAFGIGNEEQDEE